MTIYAIILHYSFSTISNLLARDFVLIFYSLPQETSQTLFSGVCCDISGRAGIRVTLDICVRMCR